ncbi:MAG: hypothetical protein AAF415_11790 [Pseudomonadota bacterium]
MTFSVVLTSLAAIAAFALAFQVSGLLGRALSAGGMAREAMAVMGDKTLADEEKEARVQKAALGLFGAFFRILLLSVAILIPSVLIVLGADLAGLAPWPAVEDFLLSWEVIIGATVLICALIWWKR